jgi:hypothetical protein
VGIWEWKNDKYESKIHFTWREYYVETFLEGTNIKVRETYLFYEIDNDTINFAETAEIMASEVTSKYVIKELTDTSLMLEDLDRGTADRYTRISDDMPDIRQFKANEFYNTEGGMTCISGQPYENYLNCLSFKQFSIESSKREVERKFGSPYNILEHMDVTYHVYVLKEVEKTEAYLAINYQDGKIASMQMTGLYSIEDLSFSSIRLGDYYTMVISRLGEPSKREKLEDGIELWDYAPYSFSFEIRFNQVYSIKLLRP